MAVVVVAVVLVLVLVLAVVVVVVGGGGGVGVGVVVGGGGLGVGVGVGVVVVEGEGEGEGEGELKCRCSMAWLMHVPHKHQKQCESYLLLAKKMLQRRDLAANQSWRIAAFSPLKHQNNDTGSAPEMERWGSIWRCLRSSATAVINPGDPIQPAM